MRANTEPHARLVNTSHRLASDEKENDRIYLNQLDCSQIGGDSHQYDSIDLDDSVTSETADDDERVRIEINPRGKRDRWCSSFRSTWPCTISNARVTACSRSLLANGCESCVAATMPATTTGGTRRKSTRRNSAATCRRTTFKLLNERSLVLFIKSPVFRLTGGRRSLAVFLFSLHRKLYLYQWRISAHSRLFVHFKHLLPRRCRFFLCMLSRVVCL